MCEIRKTDPVGRVHVFGSLNVDLVAYVDKLPAPGETRRGNRFLKSAGGKGLNQAIAAVRAGASVVMSGAMGDDEYGRWLSQVAGENGIDIGNVVIEPGTPTGIALIEVDANGENRIIVISGANAAAYPTALNFSQGEIVVAQLETPLPAVLRVFEAAKAAGASTILNPAPAQNLPSELLALCDIVIPNQYEAEQLTGIATSSTAGAIQAAEALRGNNRCAIVITRGAQGALLVDGQGARFQSPFTVEPVDTTGAGDAFCGALAASLASGEALDYALTFAAAAGALATTTVGSGGSASDLMTILKFIDQRSGV